MPRLPAQNQAIKDKRRAKLLDAGLKMFVAKDYADVTIDGITKTARCSHGLFYHYFPTTEAMFVTLCDEVIRQSKVDRWVEETRSLHGAAGLKQVCGYIEEGQSLEGKDLTVLLAVIRLFGAERGTKNEDFLNRYNLHPMFLRLIQEGQQEGKVIDGDPEDIERTFFTLATAILEKIGHKKTANEKPIPGETLYRFLTKN